MPGIQLSSRRRPSLQAPILATDSPNAKNSQPTELAVKPPPRRYFAQGYDISPSLTDIGTQGFRSCFANSVTRTKGSEAQSTLLRDPRRQDASPTGPPEERERTGQLTSLRPVTVASQLSRSTNARNCQSLATVLPPEPNIPGYFDAPQTAFGTQWGYTPPDKVFTYYDTLLDHGASSAGPPTPGRVTDQGA